VVTHDERVAERAKIRYVLEGGVLLPAEKTLAAATISGETP
jgi:hypothetical protein